MTEPIAVTATLLAHGRVLITGRFGFHAELYDPSTGTFARTGDPNNHNDGPTATLLTDGKVLIAGGDIGEEDGASPSAELYDPATGTFAATRDMAVARERHTATLLQDGTVLLAGGLLVGGVTSGVEISVEIYDPIGIFSITGSMATVRQEHTATLLKNGSVLITGGLNVDLITPDAVLSSAELYGPGGLPPRIISASVEGKKLIVVGENFDSGAVVLINGEEQATRNDGQNPQTTLIAKKGGKRVKPGDKLQVRNADGSLSEEFTLTGS
jgi:hypothetical protein